MTGVEEALRRVAVISQAHRLEWALVGGIAVSVRTEPRFTRDVDLAVAVEDDARAEAVVALLGAEGYRIEAIVEQEASGRMATVRVRREVAGEEPFVDLLFASSGIEDEIVACAELLEVLPEVTLPVARPEHLLATKILAADDSRPQDRADALALSRTLDRDGIARARHALELIDQRGFSRGRDLAAALASVARQPT